MMTSKSTANRWVIVTVSFVGLFLVGGVTYTPGIFYVEWLDSFGEGSAITSIIPSLNLGLYNITAAVGSILVSRFGFKWVLICAGLLSSAGMVVSSFVHDAYLLMFTFGIATGVGFGVCFMAFGLAPAILFPEKQSLYTGLAMSGLGCGTVIMPIIMEVTIEIYGSWRAPMLIIGGLMLNICACGALLPAGRPRTDHPPDKPKSIDQYEDDKRSVFHLEMFTSVSYLLLILHGLLFATGLSVMYVHIVALVQYQTHTTKFMASILMTCFGIARFLGTIGHGFIGQLKSVNIVIQCIVAYIICAVCQILMPFITSYPAMLAVTCIAAFMFGPYGSINIPMTSNIVGIERISHGYGYFCVGCGLASIAGAPIAGVLFTVTDQYSTSFYFTAAVVLMSALVLLPVCWNDFKKRRLPSKLEKVEASDVLILEGI